MLFALIPLAQHSIVLALLVLGLFATGLLAAVTVHEASHAFLARWQGDNTACRLGRCSLNPVRHLDPMGTVMMLTVGFGWGKPVPVNGNWLRNGPLVGGALVALAGPASNLLTALALAIPIRLGIIRYWDPGRVSVDALLADPVGVIAGSVILYNVLLGVFNLLPLAPLDGFKVVLGVLPRQTALSFARLEPYGPGILMALFMLSYVNILPFGLGDILRPAVSFVLRALVGSA